MEYPTQFINGEEQITCCKPGFVDPLSPYLGVNIYG